MASNEADSPLFVMARDVPVGVRFTKVNRKVVKFESVSDLPIGLKNGVYYIPEPTDFPLFHAFIVDLDNSTMSAVLWIIQVTTSQTHGGSAKGYQTIRSIVAILKKQLGSQSRRKVGAAQSDSPSSVEVRHLLVVPAGESNNLEWSFPKGWKENCERNDRVDVYCLEVPLV
jgi:hypothetical protein